MMLAGLAASAALFVATGEPPRVVTPGTRDISPAAEPLSIEPISLEVDAGFERVYELRPTKGLFGRRTEVRYMRMSGAVKAIFPRSSYAGTAEGEAPLIPNDTVWYIGELPQELAEGETEREPGPLWADLSVSRAANSGSSAAGNSGVQAKASRVGTRPTSLWADEEYRDRRIGALLDGVLRR